MGEDRRVIALAGLTVGHFTMAIALSHNVICWLEVPRGIRFSPNDVYQLTSRSPASRIIIGFENHDFEFRAIPTLMGNNNRLDIVVPSDGDCITPPCAFRDEASNGLHAEFLNDIA